MGRNFGKILAGAAMFMLVTVVVAISFYLKGSTQTSEKPSKYFTYSSVGYDRAGNFSEKLVAIKMYNFWGYSDNLGNVMIIPQFASAGEFSSGLAAVQDAKTKLYGYVNDTGKYMIEPQYCYAGKFSEELAVCGSKSDKRLGYIDQTGKIIIPESYYEAGDFSEGLAKVRTTSDGAYSFIDKSGSVIISGDYKGASEFSEGLAAVFIDGRWGYIDKTGKIVIQPQYTQAHAFHEELAAVELNNAWGYIDIKGNFIIKNEFSQADDFSNGYAPVKFNENGLWGYINRKGITAIAGTFLEATSFYDGVSSVKDDKRWIFITDYSSMSAQKKQDDLALLPNSSKASEVSSVTQTKDESMAVTTSESMTETMNESMEETISNNNITNLVQQIQLHQNESKQLYGSIKTDKKIKKLVLKVIGEGNKEKGIYLSLQPDSDTYNLEDISIDARVEPFQEAGVYRLQLIAEFEGVIQDQNLGEVRVEILEAKETTDLALDIGLINRIDFPSTNIFVAVFDPLGNPVNNLTKENFQLYEEENNQKELGQKLEQVIQPNATEGLKLAFVFDSSLSMYNEDKTKESSYMKFAKKCAIDFIKSEEFTAKDQASIQSFGKTFTIKQNYTGNVEKLVKAINAIKPQPDTAIYDAITSSINAMKNQSGKKCIIIFTDGEDTVSTMKYAESINNAVTSGISVYSIAIGEEAKTNELKSISDKTGGEFYYLKNAKKLKDIYKDITNQLRYQYQLIYNSTSSTLDQKQKIRLVVNSNGSSSEAEKTVTVK